MVNMLHCNKDIFIMKAFLTKTYAIICAVVEALIEARKLQAEQMLKHRHLNR